LELEATWRWVGKNVSNKSVLEKYQIRVFFVANKVSHIIAIREPPMLIIYGRGAGLPIHLFCKKNFFHIEGNIK
jgi:hypothetical protein